MHSLFEVEPHVLLKVAAMPLSLDGGNEANFGYYYKTSRPCSNQLQSRSSVLCVVLGKLLTLSMRLSLQQQVIVSSPFNGADGAGGSWSLYR